jgi:hypothetical protein
MRQHFMLGS